MNKPPKTPSGASPGDLRISTEQLRKATRVLLDHLESCGHADIRIPHDYYWSVPPAKRYNPYEQPGELTLGQLSDDWVHVQRLASNAEEPVAYALVWLAALLRAAGETAAA